MLALNGRASQAVPRWSPKVATVPQSGRSTHGGAMSQALLPLVAAGGLAAAGLWLLTVWRPAHGCVVLVLAIPLTGGMPRGSIVPLLRINEVLLVIVAAGILVHELPRRRPLTFTGLDLAVLAFCLGGVLVPAAVIKLGGADADTSVWITVLSPIQYLVVYLVFSRVAFTEANLRLLINVTLLSSVVVALVAIAELANAPGLRQLIATYYPPPPLAPGDTTVFRPTSLLGHFSAVGAFALFNMILALALAAARQRGFSSVWLGVVMALNAAAILATETSAPLLVAPLAVLIIVLYARHLPWQLALAPPALRRGRAWSCLRVQFRGNQRRPPDRSGCHAVDRRTPV